MVANPQDIREKEAQKTRDERAEDLAYTINHSLYCTLTDFINPPINAATDGYLRWLIPGCGHDHSHDGHGHHYHGHCEVNIHDPHGHIGCSHSHHHEPTRWEKVKTASRQAFSKERFWQYAKGEFIGDFGAVPITIGMQRLFPDVMQKVRHITEPVMGILFRFGVEQSSKRWAKARGVDMASEVYKKHVEAVYEHEMSHFPQAVVWTGASLGLNVAYQMHADKCTHTPFFSKLALKSTSVLSGVLVTAGMVIMARMLAPHKVREFDQWTSKQVILPTTKAVGKIFGVTEDDVDRMAEKQQQRDDEMLWSNRVERSENTITLS